MKNHRVIPKLVCWSCFACCGWAACGDQTADSRDPFEATFYTGASIDSFAASQNLPPASGPRTGYVAGIDFGYRLTGSCTRRFPGQLWLYGESVYGERSAEVLVPANPAESFLAILRNASSMEAYTGLRLELLKLAPGGLFSANLYAKTQLGFLTVQGNGADVVDDHIKAALGMMMTNGDFQNSYFEAGWGRSDLFYIHRGRRFKVDAYVQWKLKDSIPFSPFLEMTVDSDLGPGADSIRTYYGINMDIRQLTCAISRACGK
jgi:hypothetical protein